MDVDRAAGRLVSNGLFAKYGLWQARRDGTAKRLEQLAAQREHLQVIPVSGRSPLSGP